MTGPNTLQMNELMHDVIFETVVTSVAASVAADGTPHIAPMGVRYRDDHVLLMPFKPSTTHANIIATGAAVLNILTDTRVFAGCVTGRRAWPTQPAEHINGVRLDCAQRHIELRLARQDDDAQRPVLHMARVHAATHADFNGFNRAQAAVIEGAVLVSRLHMLAAKKADVEMAYLQIAIDKAASAHEHEARGLVAGSGAAAPRRIHQGRRSMKILVRVRSVEEAFLAASGGADFIDLKEPSGVRSAACRRRRSAPSSMRCVSRAAACRSARRSATCRWMRAIASQPVSMRSARAGSTM